MKDVSKQPTKLERLAELIEGFGMETDQDVYFDNDGKAMTDAHLWLQWTYNFLSTRKLYHKKAAVKTALLRKMAETLLSKDELKQIDQEAEHELVD